MNFSQLLAFYEVARQRNFPRAAKNLAISQPAVTRRILEMERAHNVKLLERTIRNVVLTGPGKMLMSYVERMVALLDEAEISLKSTVELKTGRIEIGASRPVASAYLSAISMAFKKRFPGVIPVIHVENSHWIFEQVLAFRLDLGVIGIKPRHPDLIVSPFFDEALVLVVSPTHPWAKRKSFKLEELTGQSLVMREKGSGTRELIESALDKSKAKPIVGFVLPFLVLLWTSLLPFYQPLSSNAFASLSLTHYYDAISSRRFYEVIVNTFAVGLLATLCMMLLALCVSWVVYRTEVRGRRILDLLAFLPRAIPSLAVAVALMIVFLSFKNPIYNSLWILIIAYTIAYLPVATRFTHAAVMQVHRELEEAAYVSGAGFWKSLASILIPLVQPSLLNGGLVVFVLTMKVMSIATILSGTDNMLLSVYIWALWENGATGEASAVAVLMVILVGILTYLGRKLQGTLAGQDARIE
jgi:DNA-binding transcriptional LysR family regulator